MNARYYLLAGAAAAALAVSAVPSLRAQPHPSADARESPQVASSTPPADATAALQIAPGDAGKRGLRHLMGQDVCTPTGEKLGVMQDFILDASTGKIEYGVVSSDDALRFVPFGVLRHTAGTTGLVVEIEPGQWAQIPPIGQGDFEPGKPGLSPDRIRQAARPFSAMTSNQSQPALMFDSKSRWCRASQISDKAIRGTGQDLGRIEDLVLDSDLGTVTALVVPMDDLMRTSDKLLVPLDRFDLETSHAAALATTLARADILRTLEGEQLVPTGRTSAEQNPIAEATLIASARAVRQALDEQAALSSVNVRVAPENGKIVLRGTVRDVQTKTMVDTTARHAAVESEIENQVTIEGR